MTEENKGITYTGEEMASRYRTLNALQSLAKRADFILGGNNINRIYEIMRNENERTLLNTEEIIMQWRESFMRMVNFTDLLSMAIDHQCDVILARNKFDELGYKIRGLEEDKKRLKKKVFEYHSLYGDLPEEKGEKEEE